MEPRLLRHQGPARADGQLLHDGRDRGVPQRSVRLGGAEGADRLLDRGRHGRGADDADPQAAFRQRRCSSRTCGTTTRISASGISCNSGQHATWFASRSDDPAENLARVHLYPEEFYFPAGGASVHHLAAPGEFTFARLTRLDGRYRMQVLRGGLETFDDETNERLMRASTFVWPHAFARFDADVRRDPRTLRLEPHPRDPGRLRRGSPSRLSASGRRLRRLRLGPLTELLLGIDIGSASSKGVLARPDGTVVARCEQAPCDLDAAARLGRARRREGLVGATFVGLCRELLPETARAGSSPSASAASVRASCRATRTTSRSGPRSSTGSTRAPRARSTS